MRLIGIGQIDIVQPATAPDVLLGGLALGVPDLVFGKALPGSGGKGSPFGAGPDLEESVEGASDKFPAGVSGQGEEISVVEPGAEAVVDQLVKRAPAVRLDGRGPSSSGS